jgi:hypothetical protein
MTLKAKLLCPKCERVETGIAQATNNNNNNNNNESVSTH